MPLSIGRMTITVNIADINYDAAYAGSEKVVAGCLVMAGLMCMLELEGGGEN